MVVDDVRSGLQNLDRLDLVGSHWRLVENEGIALWEIWWRRAERRKYCS